MIKNRYSRMSVKIAVVIMGIVFATLPVSAFEGGPRHHGGKGADFGFEFLNQLDLTDAQKSAIAEIKHRYAPQRQALRINLQQAQQQVQANLDAQPFDEAQVRAAYQQLSPLFADMFVMRQKIKNEIRALLTADQIRQLGEKRAAWRQKIEERQAHHQTM